MIGVDRHTNVSPKLLGHVERLGERVNAGTVAGIHRMERLDSDRHLVCARMREHGSDTVSNHLARRGDVARSFRQSADNQHKTFGTECSRLVDRPLVVVDCGLPAGRIRRRKDAAAAVAADAQAVVLDGADRLAKSDGGDLAAPRVDRRNAVPRASLRRLDHIPLLADGRQIDLRLSIPIVAPMRMTASSPTSPV